MKRKIGLLALTLALAGALVGCSDGKAPAVTPTPSAAADRYYENEGPMARGAERAMDGIGDVARGAVDGAGDIINGVGDAAWDVGNGIKNAVQ